MKYRGILFDKDGTLLDFQLSWLPVFRQAAREIAAGDGARASMLLAANGFDAERNRFVGGSLFAVGTNAQIASAWARQLERESETSQITARFDEILLAESERSSVAVGGLADTLASLKRCGYRLGIATSDSRQGIDRSLGRFDVLRYFDFLAGYDSGFGVKPGGGMVRGFCDALSLKANEVIVVGDNIHDLEMGRDAGAGLCVGVMTGTGTRAELEDRADLVLDDIGGLPHWLAAVSDP